ncbi:6-deoxy-6-sulfogluconolactonase [Defluviimonas aquaemixtae]|uniref:6-deoxy-6-sulfogluconolactonase n=1 Tax=Albidovulum aquaemixtae TaxID=1542388 RepID=A0A2R8B3L8_9RHOB|nr:SMP-30/gluconolactonase/LRE family protein [Defluviimonas aquaemixtae]SPH17214.1 6-deoxy-6-sulfogluconolactonase [Defluviimonas aquaemixtae]
MTGMKVFDDTQCSLGEGPLWHPERGEFFWFDINTHRLYSRTEAGRRLWQFGEYVSAAGWIDSDRLMVASETALIDFNIETGAKEVICPLEADNPVTRSNDGRADPYGGFWIGTMGKNKESEAGAIYRYYRGELRQLYAPWSIPNAMCFTPDGGHAYLADTPKCRIWRQPLDPKGWPKGEPDLFLDLSADAYRPDGAVVDADGNLWCAHYGHGKVTVHAPDGRELHSFGVPGKRSTCPAFGSEKLQTLFVTTASQEMAKPTENDGRTYRAEVDATGQKEHRVIL